MVLKKCGFILQELTSCDFRIKKLLNSTDVIVDALFGIGLNRPLNELFCRIIAHLNASRKPVVAVDIPSGLDGDTGDIYGACVQAHTTVTFTLAKKGFFKRFGPHVTGKLCVVDIGIPRAITKKVL